MSARQASNYSGVGNLELMEAARNYNEFLVDLVAGQLTGRRRVIDFGAGTGHFAARVVSRGIPVTCVEPDAALASRINARSIPVVRALADIADNSLDGIYSLNVLEHIEDDAQTLRELANRLQPSGRLVLFVPAFQILFSGMDRKVGHIRRYRLHGLSELVAAAGLQVVVSRYADSLGFAAALLFRVFGNREGRISLWALNAFDSLIFPLSKHLDRLAGRWFGKNIVLVADKVRC